MDLVLSYHKIRNEFAFLIYDPYDKQKSVDRIQNYYDLLGLTLNSDTSMKLIRKLIRKIPGFTFAQANGNHTPLFNLNDMKHRLADNFPVIIGLDANGVGNPVGRFDHIVVIYKYDENKKLIYFFDPNYGKTHTIDATTDKSIGKSVQGNLPYLRIYPQ